MRPNRNNIENIADERPDPSQVLELLEAGENNYNTYREAALHCIRLTNLALKFILDAQNPKTAAIAVSYALNNKEVTDDKTQREFARELGLSSGTISHNVLKFKKYLNDNL